MTSVSSVQPKEQVKRLNMKRDATHAVLLVLLFVSFAYHLTRASLSIGGLIAPSAYPKAPFTLKPLSPVVASVIDSSSGLRVDDEIVSVGDRPLRGYADVGLARVEAARTGILSVVVARPTGRLALDLPLPPAPVSPPSLGDVSSVVVMDLVLPIFFLGVGFTVAWFKPDDRSAWLLLFMMQTFSNLGSSGAGFERLGPVLGTLAVLWLAFLSSCWSLSMVAFAINFPEPPAIDQRKPWLKWLLFIPLLGVAVINSGINLAVADFTWGLPFKIAGLRIGRVALILVYSSVSIFFWTLGFKVGTTKNGDSSRRLKILLTGAAVGMAPAGVLATLALLTGRSYGSGVPDIVNLIAILMMMLLPLTLAYVVIVHKAMGVGMVVRQGLQYALAQRAVRFIQIVMGFVVAFGLLEIFSDPQKRQVDRLRWMGLALIFLVFFQRGANRFRAWIDKRFFREAVDAERILAELGEHVRSIADRQDLLETVSRTIGEALHVPKVAAFVRGESGFLPAFATGYGGDALTLEFGAAGVLTCCVEALQKPQTVYLDDDRSWVRRENIPELDAAKLRDLQSEVLIPLRTKASVEGFLSLGPKSSEAAYSPSDLQLLQSVAHQTALALDNTRLVEQVATEVAKRERMTREIEIAREVQFTLLPQRPPAIAGLDLAGHCRPAAGIGGDYYDFLPLEGERAIGLAIGDIAGKGIPAALLMAGLQAALRGQALAGSRDLARLMVNINKLIFESSPSNRYATFFYGEYRNGLLCYVNAGHNAPLLLRRDGRVERLEVGGPVVGLMEVASFTEGSVDIRRGDLLLGYTDGISECMNPQGEEWSEELMIAALRQNRGLASSDLVLKMMENADAFASGAQQHDDMTLIVMKA
ncbi:MAG: SpoIIE family protein phosphatase [Vicinamibacteria bacterium]|nr:SpoIIE family protein phosphatase [Vicinamibacteria bacterium]